MYFKVVNGSSLCSDDELALYRMLLIPRKRTVKMGSTLKNLSIWTLFIHYMGLYLFDSYSVANAEFRRYVSRVTVIAGPH
jgi:hypothetical protein